EPKLLALDLAHAGSASRYRGYDFRKPFARHFVPGYHRDDAGFRDFPVFNGKYSTTCYVDEVIAALDGMFAGLEVDRREFYESLAGMFFHRPYHHLPITALATALVFDMARDPRVRGRLSELATAAGVELDALLPEVERQAADDFDLFAEAEARDPNHDPFT